MNTARLDDILVEPRKHPLRLLIVEDSSHDIELILLELKTAGYRIEHASADTQEQFGHLLSEKEFDAILADYRLPGWTGVEALHSMRAVGLDIPFILVTGTLGEEAAVDCIKQGVSDYVLKDHLSRLPAVIERALAEKALRDDNAEAHAALRLSEARNRDLVENSIYGIFRVSADGQFLDANPAILRILGCPPDPDTVAKMNLTRDLFRFPEHCAELLASCRELGQVHGAEAEWKRCDGGLVTVRLHLRRISLPGAPEAIEVVAEDVTDLRAMERQLRQAQKFEAIGQLAGGIAHDFNNVIGAILGWAELGIDQSREHPQLADRFTRIREQADRAAGLTRDLLAFARRQILQPRAVDLNAVVTTLVSFLDKVIGKDIEVKLVNGPLDLIKADPTQIEQMLMNLSLNARDAMPDGGRLVIETEMAELDESYCRFYPSMVVGRYAVISVSDTGVGMDSETRERIFEPFFTTKPRGKGTGMGLATVYGTVKQHGGFIHVYSEPAHGSLFRVYLPAMEPADGESKGIAARKATAPSLADMRGTETILLAEDHDAIREMARQALVSLGYRVLAAADGEEALRLCESETPRLAILDVVMPKVGGPAAAARLMRQFPQLEVLFTSGYSQDSEGVASAVAKAQYLQKPYSPSTLGRRVREILDHVSVPA
jgi:PAS domain S-box-containing protein